MPPKNNATQQSKLISKSTNKIILPEKPSLIRPGPEDFAFSRLLPYVCFMWPHYKPSWFHREIARKLEAVERGEIKRLMISLHPRAGKSMLTAEFFTSWWIGRNPDKEVIFCTYNQRLADDVGGKVRNLIADPSYQDVFPNVTLDPSVAAKNKFNIFHSRMSERIRPGTYQATGIDGTVTGRGAHLFIIDDPYKNRQEADSEAVRKQVKDFYLSTALTRLYPGAAVVLIMTRWHEADLSGFVLSEHKHEGWEQLIFPAIDEDNRPLWPERYSLDHYLNIKRSLGSREWNSLFQGQPLVESGNIFKREWFKLLPYDQGKLPEFILLFQSLDCGFKDQDDNDYTASITVGVFSPKDHFKDDSLPEFGILIIDCWHDRLSFPDLRRVASQDFEYVYGQNDKEVDFLLVEDKAAGISLIQELRFTGIKCLSYNPGRMDKRSRAHSVSHLVELGYVWVPESSRTKGQIMDKFSAFLAEVLAFDRGAHDDFVDAFVQALRYCSDRGYVRTPELVTRLEDDFAVSPPTTENPYAV